MPNFAKPARTKGGPSVRQTRGPGMNKGLKKPRYGKFPNPDTMPGSTTTKAAKAADPTTSYLSGTLNPIGGISKTRKGKPLSKL